LLTEREQPATSKRIGRMLQNLVILLSGQLSYRAVCVSPGPLCPGDSGRLAKAGLTLENKEHSTTHAPPAKAPIRGQPRPSAATGRRGGYLLNSLCLRGSTLDISFHTCGRPGRPTSGAERASPLASSPPILPTFVPLISCGRALGL
jgi:hypothetical protein